MAAEILNETRNLINTQIKMPELAERQTGTLLIRNELNELEKHLAKIEKRLDVLQDLKYKVKELMISEGEVSKAIDEFTAKIQEDMARFNGVVDQEQEENFRRRYEKEMRLEEMRMEMRKKYVDSEGKKSASESNKVKLPKLVISKFKGTALDWFRIWNQFETGYQSCN